MTKIEGAIYELQSYAKGSWGELSESFELAISALEKQMPLKPVQDCYETINGSFIGSGIYYKCRKCDGVVGIGANYCESCGQAIKWEE